MVDMDFLSAPTERPASEDDSTERGREALLRALLDTAAELSSLQDVESVLQSIVRRTRHLLRSDMGYISLNDHASGETYIRQSDGVTTTKYRTLRMPIGYGILGRVATGVAPYQTTDYLRDESIPHLDSIDGIVAGEGVLTIMGVPLMIGGQVIGALMVAERTSRVFSPQEVDIVDSLGKHAAVALDNAERYTRALEDAELLSREHEQSQEELVSRTQLMDFDADLLDEILRSPADDRVLTLAARTLGAPVALLSETGEQIAAAPHDAGTLLDSPLSPTQLEEAARARRPLLRSGEITDCDEANEKAGVVVAAVRSGAEAMGFLVTPAVDDPARLKLLDHAAVHMALALQFVRVQEDAQHRQQLDVVEDLLAARPISEHRLAQRLRRWQLRVHDPVWVGVLTPDQDAEAALRHLVRGLPGTRLAAPIGDQLCVVFDEYRWVEAALSGLDDQGLKVRGAWSGPMPSVRDLPRHHRTAQMALAAMRLGRRDGLVSAADVGLVGAVVHAAEQSNARGEPIDLSAPIAELVTRDANHGTELTRTAVTFFETDRRIDRTAQALFLHRSTVKQRLQSISRVLGHGWDRAPRSLDVHLALRSWSLTHSLRGH